jgi:Major intrinsic protein
MNPARTFGPDLVATDFTSYWVYVAGPLVGAVLAVGAAWCSAVPAAAAQAQVRHKEPFSRKSSTRTRGEGAGSALVAVRVQNLLMAIWRRMGSRRNGEVMGL